jgi:hypothetical protein
MIADIFYSVGTTDAWMTFTKTAAPAPVQMLRFAKGQKGKPVTPKTSPAAPVQQPAGKPPIFGGTANPAVTSADTVPKTPEVPATPAQEPGGWKSGLKSFGRDMAIQASIPLAMMGIQQAMTPSQPQQPPPPNDPYGAR